MGIFSQELNPSKTVTSELLRTTKKYDTVSLHLLAGCPLSSLKVPACPVCLAWVQMGKRRKRGTKESLRQSRHHRPLPPSVLASLCVIRALACLTGLFSSVADSCLTLRPRGPQHARPPCPPPTPGVFPKLMSIESVMPSNPLIICCPLLLLPSIFANKPDRSGAPAKSSEDPHHCWSPQSWSQQYRLQFPPRSCI